jgi:thiol:disulfide interchange protein DsbD
VLLGLAVAVAAAVALLPALIPTGPANLVDVSSALNGQRLGAIALVFLGGLLTSLTPCVYPLIPVTVSIFGASKAQKRSQALAVTAAYVLGLSSVFAALGVAAAKGGQAFGSLLGRPEVALGLAVLLIALASSMFGAFSLELPPRIASKLSSVGGGGVAGAFLMGGVSGFIAAPCTGPVLTGLLTFVASSQNTLLGALLLFVYALGMGLPFVAIGVFAVRLPKAGVWMEWVKSALGVMLLALAFTYARDAFPAARAFSAQVAERLGHVPGIYLAATLALLGVLLGAIDRSFHDSSFQKIAKGLGVALVVLALILRLGSLNVTQGQGGGMWTWKVRFGAPQDAVEQFDRALAQAAQDHRPVLIDFAADWCAACKELDRETYSAAPVVAEGQRFVTIKVDGTNEPESVQALYKRFGVQGLPTIAFVSSAGALLNSPRVTGFIEPDAFLSELHKVQ